MVYITEHKHIHKPKYIYIYSIYSRLVRPPNPEDILGLSSTQQEGMLTLDLNSDDPPSIHPFIHPFPRLSGDQARGSGGSLAWSHACSHS